MEDNKLRKKEFSPIAATVGWFLSLVVFLFLSLLLSIAIEWIGIFTFWKEEGVSHSRDMYLTELRYANTSLKSNFQGAFYRDAIVAIISGVDQGIESLKEYAGGVGNRVSSSNAGIIASKLGESALYITKTFILRVFVIIFALPIFALALWYAFVDGAVERELRKYGNDKESNVIFDYTSKISFWIVGFGSMIYLTMPFSINPIFCIVPTFVAFFYLIRISVTKYKKYV